MCIGYVNRNDSRCTNGDIRLTRQTEGPLEICLTGNWRIVCSSNVGMNEGSVVCNTLNYSCKEFNMLILHEFM